MSARLLPKDVLFAQRLLAADGLYDGPLDGIWGPLTDAAQRAFEVQGSAIKAALGTFDVRSETNIATLTLRAQRAARAVLAAVNGGVLGANVLVRVISGTRTYQEQNALFRQGRFGNAGPIVTNARGGYSNHNFGIAWDIAIFQHGSYVDDSILYRTAGQINLASTPGVEWGGDWTSIVDVPHYQLATGLTVAALRDRFETGQALI